MRYSAASYRDAAFQPDQTERNGMDNTFLHALEYERCAAFVSGDLRRIEALIAPELVYVHATGLVHGRAELLAFVGERMRYRAMERKRLVARVDVCTAWLTGLMRIEGRRLPSGEPVQAVSFVIQIWRREKDRWQMVLLQSTKVDEAAWEAA